MNASHPGTSAPVLNESGEAGQFLDTAFDGRNWAIVTATRENHGSWDSPDNHSFNDAMRAELAARDFAVTELRGVWRGVDQGPSFLIEGLSPASAASFGRRHCQHSVITSAGLKWSDGRQTPFRPNGHLVGGAATTRENYSVFPDGSAVALALDFGATRPVQAARPALFSYVNSIP